MKSFLLAVAALLLLAGTAGAQDVIQRGRMRGTQPPRWVRNALARNPNAFEFRRAWRPNLQRARAARGQLRSQGRNPAALSPQLARQNGTAVTGIFRVPVVAVLYANTAAAPYTTADLQAKLFTGPSSGITLTQFYGEMSRRLVSLTGSVAGWAQVSRADTVYEGSDNGDNVGDLLREALDKVDATVDFSQYDSNGDGYVDFVAFVQPETGGECGPKSTNRNIWSHRWTYEAATGRPAYQTNDGVKISDYVIQPALNCDGTTMIDIGVFAHEFGHAFGIPDLYATDYSNGGIGAWGLMGSGSWNRPSSPAHLEAWSKAELGWMPVVTASPGSAQPQSISLGPAETTGNAVRIDVPNTPGEYFLLENRQRLGTDRYLVQPGLLVWHVDSARMVLLGNSNSVNNNAAHKSLELVEADGRYDLRTENGRTEASDPFPGTAGVVAFGPSTSPASTSFAGTRTGVTLANVVDGGPSGAVTLQVSVSTARAVWGDVTGDAVVDATDLAQYLRRVAGAGTYADFTRGDVDADGDVDATDALIVQSYVAAVDVSRFRVGQAAQSPPSTPGRRR